MFLLNKEKKYYFITIFSFLYIQNLIRVQDKREEKLLHPHEIIILIIIMNDFFDHVINQFANWTKIAKVNKKIDL